MAKDSSILQDEPEGREEMTPRSLSLVLTLLIYSFSAPSTSKVQKEIIALLDQQVSDWNSGDIDAFMEGYWKSDSLRFVSSSGVIYGWSNTLERYRNKYPDRAAMRHLVFDSLAVRLISNDSASAAGRWFLEKGEDDLGGQFTLQLRRINDKWLIVADHTS